MGRVVVIGGGPAGSVFAARMAQFGHEVALVERQAFPRDRLGESLTPGVLPLLGMAGALPDVERAAFPRARLVEVRWEGERRERIEEGGNLLVDRGRFDALLLQRARALGVRIVQPATARPWRVGGVSWTVQLASDGESLITEVDLVADASGRAGPFPVRRRMDPVRTVALHAYWRAADLPDHPSIEAADEAWFWRVPIPDGRHNVLAFVDASRLKRRQNQLACIYRRLIATSGILANSATAVLAGPVRAVDATPYIDEESVTPSRIKIGEAALAIDPISSSGVQKAVQTSLAAAVVANTLLRQPQSAEMAMEFYISMLRETFSRHRRWAATHYRAVAAVQPTSFWADRAREAIADPPSAAPVGSWPTAVIVALSPLVRFVERPCIQGEFVVGTTAIDHPDLGSLAFLGSWELAPLLRGIRPRMTVNDVACAWAERMPLRSALATVAWLLDHGILVVDPRP